MIQRLSPVLLALVLAAVPLGAESWPQWRGPQLNGISSERGLPLRWSKTQNVAWTLPLPEWSGSTPIVWNDHVFLNVAQGADLHLWAIDRATGTRRWTRRLGGENRKMMKQNMSTPSPVTDGRHVWVMTGTGLLKAFDFAGTELWSRNIQDDYGRFGLMHGYGSSPLLHEGSLYVQVLHGMMTDDPSYVLRIDAASGKTRWRVAYCSGSRPGAPGRTPSGPSCARWVACSPRRSSGPACSR